MRSRPWLALVIPGVLLLLAACSPGTSFQAEAPYFRGGYDGPIEGVAIVMNSPAREYRDLADTVYMHSLTGFARHPYARERFDMVERSEIDRIVEEHRLGSSGFVDARTAPQLGQLLGANHVLLVDLLGAEVRPASVSGLQIAGMRLGGSGATLHVSLMMRIIDTTTGRVRATGYGETASSALTGFSMDRTRVNTPATTGMIQDLLPETVMRSLNDLFRNLDF